MSRLFVRNDSLTAILSYLLLFCSIINLCGCSGRSEFHYESGHAATADAGEDASMCINGLERNKELKMLESYECIRSPYVDMFPDSRLPDYANSAEDLLEALDGYPNQSWLNDLPPVYSDDVITVTAQEPRYSKMLFNVLVHTSCQFESLELVFAFDDSAETKAATEICFVAPTLVYRGIVTMPPDAKKVKLIDAKFTVGQFTLSDRMKFNSDQKRMLIRKGNNTLQYCVKESTILLVMNSAFCITDCLIIDGTGTAVVSYGAKYFYVVDRG